MYAVCAALPLFAALFMCKVLSEVIRALSRVILRKKLEVVHNCLSICPIRMDAQKKEHHVPFVHSVPVGALLRDQLRLP